VGAPKALPQAILAGFRGISGGMDAPCGGKFRGKKLYFGGLFTILFFYNNVIHYIVIKAS
jgi:hypothetical protein